MRTGRVIVVAAIAVFVLFTSLGGVVSAHHSRAGYDKRVVTLKGVVTSVAWRNPHVFVMFSVKDEKGNVVNWSGELSSISTMLAAGMSKDTLKPGDEIVITGSPAEAGTPQSLIAKLTRADGSVVVGDSYRSDTR